MKKLAASIIGVLAFSVAAIAQTPADPSQGTPSPSMSQPSQQQPSMPQPDSAAAQPTATSADTSSTEKSGDKQLRGCVQSQGGQFILESKKGNSVTLTGQDVSAHVGHEVVLKGTWEAGSAVSTGNNAAEKTFNVTSVEMIAENCGGKNNPGDSGNTGATPPSSSGSDATGSTSTPPQQ